MVKTMHLFMPFVILILFVFVIDGNAWEKNLVSSFRLDVDGLQRSYSVYQPENENVQGRPLMIVLHGGLGNSKTIEKNAAMNEIAQRENFLVVYPDGTSLGPFRQNRRIWNAGTCCGPASKKNVDDVKFIKLMIEDVAKRFGIDSKRVYVAGMSNGAMMAYRLMCEIPDQIAAVVAVSGTLAVDNCDGAKDIPVLHIHGTADKFVPINGGSGAGSRSGAQHRSLAKTIEIIAKGRQCAEPSTRMLGDKIQQTTYASKKGAPLQLILIEQGAHSWPGGKGRGNKNEPGHGFNASQYAWDFVKAFSK